MSLQIHKKQIHILSCWYSIPKADNHQLMQRYFFGLYHYSARWSEGLSRRKHHHDSLSAEELTGSNHFLVLIWFLLFNSHWSICHWEMSGAFVDVSHWKFGWGAGHQSKNEGVDLTHHPEFTTSEPDLSDLRNVTGDLLSDMTWSVSHLLGLGQVRHLPRCLFLNGLRIWCTLMLHEKLTKVRSRTYIRIYM